MTTRSKIAVNPLLREIEIGDQILLFDPVKDTFYALNLAGKLMWIEAKRQSAITSHTKMMAAFFGGKPAEYSADIDAAIEVYIANEIFVMISANTSQISPPVVQLSPHSHPLTYEAPTVRIYSAEWMKKNHPSAFLSVKFSDTWSPACDDPV